MNRRLRFTAHEIGDFQTEHIGACTRIELVRQNCEENDAVVGALASLLPPFLRSLADAGSCFIQASGRRKQQYWIKASSIVSFQNQFTRR